MLSRLNHSLSAKLLLLFICAGAILLLLVGSIVGKGFANAFRTSTEPFITHYVELMERELGSPPSQANAITLTQSFPVDIHFYSKTETWSTAEPQPILENLSALFNNSNTRTFRQYQLRSQGSDLLLSAKKDDYQIFYQIHQLRNNKENDSVSFNILLSILAILAFIYFVTNALFKPIELIQQGVNLIGAGKLDHRIIRRRNDQLGDLADNVNAMADDISEMLEAKRQLLLGISHELRSPLTRTRVHLALMENSSSKQEIEKDIILMDEMINELLESERFNSRHVSLNKESVHLDQLILQLVNQEFSRKIKIMDMDGINAELDSARIKLLLRNLLQNAIKHSLISKRRPTISLVNAPDGFSIYVADSGEGIDPEHIPYLTDPFYRADPSRQRKTGGFGLGLHLCRKIVEAHGGALLIKSETGIGTTIQCSFPQ